MLLTIIKGYILILNAYQNIAIQQLNFENKMAESNKRHSQVNVKVCDFNEQNVEHTVPINISNTTSIIRIVPKTVTLPHNSSLKTFIVNCSNNLQSKSSLSASTSNGTDNKYVNKEKIESPVNLVFFNEPSEQVTETETPVHGIIIEKSTIINESKINLKRHLEDNASKIPKKTSKIHSENCCEICRNTLEIILQKQEEILRYLKNTPLNFGKDIKFDLLPSMPFDDLNDFLDFDESLSNENVLDQLITKLQRLLVSVDKRSISNILGSLMTNDLCKKISWIGIKDTIAFQNTNMVYHIISKM
ncbi:uncharacterized protein LOC131663188 isoform X2 [Phymastichus coffea]|uniref:uncharacterized protein LOC131663188 isoform X2 n=1 Tax=Phymastichus coffea TaxID=108790 RepID=UPI00273BEB0B|nr:uncharacterized protein LOC131663188 isoform X2 [Phymastichus coffea]